MDHRAQHDPEWEAILAPLPRVSDGVGLALRTLYRPMANSDDGFVTLLTRIDGVTDPAATELPPRP